MNHTNKIECRQNENNRRPHRYHLLNWEKFGIQVICLSLLVLLWVAPLIHIRSHYTHSYTHWIHTSNVAVAVAVSCLYMPFVFRRAWKDKNSFRWIQYQYNTSTERLSLRSLIFIKIAQFQPIFASYKNKFIEFRSQRWSDLFATFSVCFFFSIVVYGISLIEWWKAFWITDVRRFSG